MRFLFFISGFFLSLNSYGRVFDFDTQSFSTYLRGSGGYSNLQREAYQGGFPSTIGFNDSNGVSNAYSAEIGFAITKPAFTTRLGIEFLYPYTPGSSNASNASGPLFNVSNFTFSVIPQVDFEIYIKRKPSYRLYVGLGGGYGIAVFKNTITMTAWGNATYPSLQNYIEEATGSGIMGQSYFGIEFPAFDNVSLSLDLGYRYFIASNYTSNRDYTSPLGTFQTGSPIKNADGSARTTDLSGVFMAFNFRFYFNQ